MRARYSSSAAEGSVAHRRFPRDPGTGKTADELLRSEAWALKHELRCIESKLTSAACSLIQTIGYMVDQDHDAFHSLQLIEDALVSAGDRLAKLLRVIDPASAGSDAEAQP